MSAGAVRQQRRIARKIFPEVVDVRNVAGGFDVVEHGTHLGRRVRILDRHELPLDTETLARFLVGKILVREARSGLRLGRIVGEDLGTIEPRMREMLDRLDARHNELVQRLDELLGDRELALVDLDVLDGFDLGVGILFGWLPARRPLPAPAASRAATESGPQWAS